MAYYRLSKVVKMRREALECNRDEFDVEGPAGMTVYRMEEGKHKTSEKTYRRLTRAMGMEESTGQGMLKTNDLDVLHLVNEITHCFQKKDYDAAENMIAQLENSLDDKEFKNKQYLDYKKLNLHYRAGKLRDEEYEYKLKEILSGKKLGADEKISRKWPFTQEEWKMLLDLAEVIRSRKQYEQQETLLECLLAIMDEGYMESEYRVGYLMSLRWRMGDVLGNVKEHRRAIEIDEKTIEMCEAEWEIRCMAEVYYDIFWNYWMIKKKETLTELEEERCRECLLKAYYINQALFPSKELYKKRLQECYPEELV